jgi:hypothetical protein
MKTWVCFLAACIGFCQSSVLAQSKTNFTEIEVSGVLLRIPGEYLRIDLQSVNTKKPIPSWMLRFDRGILKADEIAFRFWLSDGKPPKTSGVGPAFFWPPDPGRASMSAEDFVVTIRRLTYLSTKEAARIRPFLPLPHVEADLAEKSIVEGIECQTYRRTARIRCQTPAPADPSADLISIGPLTQSNPWLSMYVFSRADDNLDFAVDFPAVGLGRWSEIVCKTVAMVRLWRVASGPAPPDCSKLPRLASAKFQAPTDGDVPC